MGGRWVPLDAVGHGGGSVGGTTGFQTRPPQGAVVAIVGNVSQAPTGGLIVALITEAFLQPETLAVSGADMTGDFEGVVTTGSEEVVRGTMKIGGSPTRYWGRIAWNNDTVDRVIYSASSPEKTQLVTVDGNAALLELQFTTIDDGELHGTWRSRGSGEVSCSGR